MIISARASTTIYVQAKSGRKPIINTTRPVKRKIPLSSEAKRRSNQNILFWLYTGLLELHHSNDRIDQYGHGHDYDRSHDQSNRSVDSHDHGLDASFHDFSDHY